jgi:hypothetical protein
MKIRPFYFLSSLKNLLGWRTDRKIIVFESDDWGSIRMPSIEAFRALRAEGVDLESGDSYRYNRNDTLASVDDLSGLFEVLSSFKTNQGITPCFTAVCNVANPDFEKIEKGGFQRYFYEPFPNTLAKYGLIGAFPMWLTGIREKVFYPQFHGREHLNVAAWMHGLKNAEPQTLLAFKFGLWGFNNRDPRGVNYQAAFDLVSLSEIEGLRLIIADGLRLFESLFGYRALHFVPPNGPFNNQLEATAAENGIRYMSAAKIQREPVGGGATRTRLHYLGQLNRNGQRYITRNCFFEPNREGVNWVDFCLREIYESFRWKKPAVISTHRVNYIGGLNAKNRDTGLYSLKHLLMQILKTWPDVEFLTSDQLGSAIMTSKM